MSGILDSKSRVIDTIVTLEGRKQIAAGKLKVEFVSFTDNATYYRADVVSGSADASGRIYLEASHLPQDQITFEADDSGRLKPFANGDGIAAKDGQILQYSFTPVTTTVLSSSQTVVTILSGSEFASTAESLLASSISNFQRLRVISTKDAVFEDDGFSISDEVVEFVITNEKPISDSSRYSTHIDHLDSLFNDVRLSKIDNFKYLPPVNKIEDRSIDKKDYRQTSSEQLGNYKPWGRTHIDGLSPAQLEFELSQYESIGYCKTLSFDPTSRNNSLVGQAFELGFSTVKKLDVIDYGQYVWKGSLRHAFFVGKLLTDNNGANTFIHMFTMVFG